MDNWLSFSWFSPAQLQHFQWEQPAYLFAIPVVLLLFGLRRLIHSRFQQRLPVAVPGRHLRWSPVSLLRFVPDTLIGLALLLVLLALARPQQMHQRVVKYSEGIDIMLVIDISESMLIEDLKPNRLESAKAVAHKFIEGRFQDRIGIVVFAGDAYSLVPLTTDYDLLHSYVDEINQDLIASGGTAIGSALAVTINRMRDSDAKSKVAILLSDGDNTAGNIDPVTAARMAKAYDIKVYTIAVGQDGAPPVSAVAREPFAADDNTIDERTLREIAQVGEGQFFRATNSRALLEVFSDIDTFEKAEIRETRYADTQDYYQVYLIWAIIFFLLWMLSKSTFMSNATED
jgi:Ca-activated chloride channel homolog